MKVTREWVDERRKQLYRLAPDKRLRSAEDAEDFVGELGMVSLFSCKDLSLPSLFDAFFSDTEDNNAWWSWKDVLSADKRVFYGRLLTRKAILSTWEVFDCFYALAGNSGECDECFMEFQRGRLGVTAKNICRHLYDHGPTPSNELRDAVHMSDKRMKYQFDKAMVELQVAFHIVKVGWQDRRWGVDVWDLMPRWIAERLDNILRIQAESARKVILSKYVAACGVLPADTANNALGWDESSFTAAVEELKSERIVIGLDLELGEEIVPALGSPGFVSPGT